MMTRKNRVGGLEEMRNGLPMRTPGDKEYGHPDYAKDYFKVRFKLNIRKVVSFLELT